MDIIWKYLDKRSAAIEALKDYEAMKFIIRNTDSEIVEERERMVSIGSHSWDGDVSTHSTDAVQNRIINGIEEIDILKERYRQAMEYMAWFEPAWNQLSEDEHYVLDSFYCSNVYGKNAALKVADYFKIEQASAYRKKNRALDRLTVLLFGKF